jgi:hypothetical protein
MNNVLSSIEEAMSAVMAEAEKQQEKGRTDQYRFLMQVYNGINEQWMNAHNVSKAIARLDAQQLPKCHNCGQPHNTGIDVCQTCANGLKTDRPAVERKEFQPVAASNKPSLNWAQAQAIFQFAQHEGRNWKSALNQAWMSGNYPYHVKDGGALQQIRNGFGPRWLASFKLK